MRTITTQIINRTTHMLDTLITAFSLPFMQRALLAGVAIAMSTAFLSVFVTLRNMSFYADAISHAALAGIAIGILLGVSPFIAAVVFCVLLAIGTVFVKKRTTVSIDTLMGVLFASGMALGITIISRMQGVRADLFSLLFGDILTVSWIDVTTATILTGTIIIYLLWNSKALLLTTFSPDFSRVRNINISILDYTFFAITALTIALSLKIVGIILITGLLVLPGAIGKNLAHSFKQMVGFAIGANLLATIMGIGASYYIDIPSGPAIILVGTLLFILSLLVRRR